MSKSRYDKQLSTTIATFKSMSVAELETVPEDTLKRVYKQFRIVELRWSNAVQTESGTDYQKL